MSETLLAGSAVREITPRDSQFLQGYPHVARYSTDVHDPLLSSALYLSDGRTDLIIIANDIIFVNQRSVQTIRRQIAEQVPVPTNHIMVTATHTHSGPKTHSNLSTEKDAAVPPPDEAYICFMEQRMVQAGIDAVRRAQPVQIGLAVADATGIGTNRRDPKGPCDLRVPVLLARSLQDKQPVACMLICCMHPTVLHEDSTLVSADFPGLTRQWLQEHVVGHDCPVLHHTGPAGNQSPRHVTRANTFAEAQRLGQILAEAVAAVIPGIQFTADMSLRCKQALVDLPRREFPSVPQAENKLSAAVARLEELRNRQADEKEIRTAECDWFGAEETLTLAQAEEDGRLEQVYRYCLPAEIQCMRIGAWHFVGWPGELFVEYQLEVKRQCPDTWVISLANGVLQGYIATEQAQREGGYEASNTLFSWRAGEVLVQKTIELVNH